MHEPGISFSLISSYTFWERQFTFLLLMRRESCSHRVQICVCLNAHHTQTSPRRFNAHASAYMLTQGKLNI